MCKFCSTNSVENEKHFLLECSLYNDERSKLFEKLDNFCDFTSLNSDDKFSFLMSYNNGDYEILKLVLPFINKSVTIRNSDKAI